MHLSKQISSCILFFAEQQYRNDFEQFERLNFIELISIKALGEWLGHFNDISFIASRVTSLHALIGCNQVWTKQITLAFDTPLSSFSLFFLLPFLFILLSACLFYLHPEHFAIHANALLMSHIRYKSPFYGAKQMNKHKMNEQFENQWLSFHSISVSFSQSV